MYSKDDVIEIIKIRDQYVAFVGNTPFLDKDYEIKRSESLLKCLKKYPNFFKTEIEIIDSKIRIMDCLWKTSKVS